MFCLLVSYRRGSGAEFRPRGRFDADLKYYQAHPAKAKKRFSSLLSKISSPKTLNRVRIAKARKSSKSMDKRSDAIARKMMRLMEKRGSRSFSSISDKRLQDRFNDTMTKVSYHYLAVLVSHSCL
jgi:hypothetical protein